MAESLAGESDLLLQAGQLRDAVQVAGGIELVLCEQTFEEGAPQRELLQGLLGQHDGRTFVPRRSAA
jgi:hypothetical protein